MRWRRAGSSGRKKKHFAKKKNPDLWERFLHIYPKHPAIRFQWMPGVTTATRRTELADRLAVAAREQALSLPADEAYERMGEGGLFD